MMKLKRLYTGLTAVFFMSVNSLAQSPQQMDLGLSVDWAVSNLGAVFPEEFGGYYGWADPTGNETTADVLDNTRNWISDLYGGAEPPAEISGTTLDIARTVLGDGWRLPTLEEMKELTDCRHQWTRINGVNGYEITGKNGVKIFLPAGGARNGEDIRYAGAVDIIGRGPWAQSHRFISSAPIVFISVRKVSITTLPYAAAGFPSGRSETRTFRE